MTEAATTSATFIIRLWTDEELAGNASWGGIAERVGSERQCAVQSLPQLMDWMRRELVELAPTVPVNQQAVQQNHLS